MDTGIRAAAPDVRVLSLALTAGVLAVYFGARLPVLWVLLPGTLPALLPWRGRAAWSALVLGALLATWQAQQRLDERWPASRHGQDIEVRGVIAERGEVEVHCEFCNRRYAFDAVDSEAIFAADIAAAAARTRH